MCHWFTFNWRVSTDSIKDRVTYRSFPAVWNPLYTTWIHLFNEYTKLLEWEIKKREIWLCWPFTFIHPHRDYTIYPFYLSVCLLRETETSLEFDGMDEWSRVTQWQPDNTLINISQAEFKAWIFGISNELSLSRQSSSLYEVTKASQTLMWSVVQQNQRDKWRFLVAPKMLKPWHVALSVWLLITDSKDKLTSPQMWPILKNTLTWYTNTHTCLFRHKFNINLRNLCTIERFSTE